MLFTHTRPVVASAGRRCTGRHGEAVPAADIPPQPPLPVEAAPGTGEEEATGLVSHGLPAPLPRLLRQGQPKDGLCQAGCVTQHPPGGVGEGKSWKAAWSGKRERIQWWAFQVAGAMSWGCGLILMDGWGAGHEFLIPGAVNVGTLTH